VARSILADARAAISDRQLSDSVAVHDFRKAMKRWRALLRLLEPFLGEQGRAHRIRARDLARELGRPRDAQSALNGLDDALKHDSKFPAQSLQLAREHLEKLRSRAETAMLNKKTRARIRTAIRSASRAVDRWPVGSIGFDDLTDSLTTTYRRARRRIPDDWSKASAEELHELRRRVIEHRYQMELVAPLWPSVGKAWVDEAQRLRDRLGRYQDLVVLTELSGRSRPLSRWHSRLAGPVEERQSVHLAAAARLARRLFAERPKAFRRRMRALGKAQE
jgi:CHAD domain-containing protein